MTKEQIFDRIIKWEAEAGESFNDYFSHDNISDNSWAFFLLGKGFIEHGNIIIDEILNNNRCIDQDILYDIKPSDGDSLTIKELEANWDFNTRIMAEFISSTKFYTDKFLNFMDEKSD